MASESNRLYALALACTLAGGLAGYNSAVPNEGRWVATGPKNLFVLDTHTGEVKSPVTPLKPAPELEPVWFRSCEATRERLLELEQEGQELEAKIARVEEAVEERQRRNPLESISTPVHHSVNLLMAIANRKVEEEARAFLSDNCE